MGLYILYQDDHAARAKALQNVIGGTADEVTMTKPRKVKGLHTLVFWGHGEQNSLCHYDPKSLFKDIAKWRKLNSGLKTIEIITCNARHCDGKADPFADRLKHHLKWDIFHKTRSLTLKALPVGVRGKTNAWSILLTDTATKSWVYITAPGTTDADLQKASNLIKLDRGPRGVTSYNGDIALKADKLVRARTQKWIEKDPTSGKTVQDWSKKQTDISGEEFNADWTMNYGYFNTLRACLVEVK